MNRQYPSHPFVAVAVVVQNKRKILLIRRGRPPKKNSWAIPGGLVELGESIRDAAIREVREECGLEIKLDGILDVVDFIEKDPNGTIKYHYVITDFAASYVSGVIVAGDDAAEAAWVTADKLIHYPIPEIIRHIIELALQKTADN
ncbi:NUDIX hydrolase [bacterium]|nr:NUDIX hydrolase [bacterium]